MNAGSENANGKKNNNGQGRDNSLGSNFQLLVINKSNQCNLFWKILLRRREQTWLLRYEDETIILILTVDYNPIHWFTVVTQFNIITLFYLIIFFFTTVCYRCSSPSLKNSSILPYCCNFPSFLLNFSCWFSFPRRAERTNYNVLTWVPLIGLWNLSSLW